MLDLLFRDPAAFFQQLVLIVPGFLLAVTVHELSHGLTADRLGDDTPRRSGRLTLNPLPHIDPVGALAFLVAGFGWARPVRTDVRNLRRPVRDMALIAAAGPAANFVLAFVALVGFVLAIRLAPPPFVAEPLQGMLRETYRFNLVLGVFNLLPVPPLDGGHFLRYLLPRSTWGAVAVLERYGPFLLIGLVVSGVSGPLVQPVYRALHQVFATVVGWLL
jgi:Zn-dependent protease